MKKLVLFIHGLGGKEVATWKKFPGLIEADADVAARYIVAPFNYDTGFFGSQPSLANARKF